MKTNADATCPKCERRLDAATAVSDEAQPKEGDVSICAYCLAILVFNDDLTLHEATDEEIAGYPIRLLAELRRTRIALDKARQSCGS